jgi:hypothetical protein
MKTTLNAWILVMVLVVFTIHRIEAACETLDFNDNQVPGGWQLDGNNVGANFGIGNGRLYARATDSGARLVKSLPAGTQYSSGQRTSRSPFGISPAVPMST